MPMKETGGVFSFLCPRRVLYPEGCPVPLQGVLKVSSLALESGLRLVHRKGLPGDRPQAATSKAQGVEQC